MENLVRGFYKVLHRFHTCRPKLEQKGDLTNVEFFLLIGISGVLEQNRKDPDKENEKGIALSEIIRLNDMSMSAVSKKISILEKKGLIERKNSMEDRRNVYITLTDKGKEICLKEKKSKQAWTEELIQRMGTEDAKELIRLVNRMLDVIVQMEEEKSESR